jgi:hypothetical protein
MKKLTCKDLGGVCDLEIAGDLLEEIGQKSRAHVIEQIKNGDSAHRTAAEKMRNASPTEQKAMMVKFEKRFNEAPNV